MSGPTFADLGIVTRANGVIEQRLPCPRCDCGPQDDALGVNVETGAFHCFRCGWAGGAGLGETRATAPLQRRNDPESATRMGERLEGVWFETDEGDAAGPQGEPHPAESRWLPERRAAASEGELMAIEENGIEIPHECQPLAFEQIPIEAYGDEPRVNGHAHADERPVTAADFWAYMPAHAYIYVPTRELWPAASINSC